MDRRGLDLLLLSDRFCAFIFTACILGFLRESEISLDSRPDARVCENLMLERRIQGYRLKIVVDRCIYEIFVSVYLYKFDGKCNRESCGNTDARMRNNKAWTDKM